MLKDVKEILDICKAHKVPNGWFHTTLGNVEQVIRDDYRVLMALLGAATSCCTRAAPPPAEAEYRA